MRRKLASSGNSSTKNHASVLPATSPVLLVPDELLELELLELELRPELDELLELDDELELELELEEELLELLELEELDELDDELEVLLMSATLAI